MKKNKIPMNISLKEKKNKIEIYREEPLLSFSVPFSLLPTRGNESEKEAHELIITPWGWVSI